MVLGKLAVLFCESQRWVRLRCEAVVRGFGRASKAFVILSE